MSSSASRQQQQHHTPTFAQSLVAGGIAGTTVDLSLYPIDTLKTRLQSSAGFVASGGFRGVYAGVGSAVVGSAPGAALFFVTYEGVKGYLGERRRRSGSSTSDDTSRPTSNGGRTATELQQQQQQQYGAREAGEHMLAASLGEIAACVVRVPTEVVKQRAQANQKAGSMGALRGILDVRRTSRGLVGVWSELYRGWGITVLREVPFTVIQFPLWEAMKRWAVRRRTSKEGGGNNTPTTAESATFGCVSGAVAAALTTPLDVLKTRMMLAKEKTALVSMTKDIWRREGAKAFLAGIAPRCGWISAGGAIFLGAYQWASNVLERAV